MTYKVFCDENYDEPLGESKSYSDMACLLSCASYEYNDVWIEEHPNEDN